MSTGAMSMGETTGVRWEPIETAPWDGPPVLLWRESTKEHYVAARIRGAHGPGWCTPDGYEIFRATHWMPLPASSKGRAMTEPIDFDPQERWGDCRVCDSSFEFDEDGLPYACSNPECRCNTETDELEATALFAIALGFIKVSGR